VNTLVLGAQGPLGLACIRAVLASGASVVAAVQHPHRIPPALQDLREEFPSQLTSLQWQAGRWPSLPPVERAIIAELPIPPAQSDEGDEPAAELLALTPDVAGRDILALLAPTLSAMQLVARLQPRRVLVQASWLGCISEKIRGGGYARSSAYAAHLMLVRAAALDLQRAGIATVVGNAGRYRLDMAGPGFHADVDDVARGLLTLLDRCQLTDEPAFLDWRGTPRAW
jgi:hypothetical protein